MAHSLNLKSQQMAMREIAGVVGSVMLYNAQCSCDQWSVKNVTAQHARELYDAHMQRVAGPEAQIARESQS